MKKKKNVLLLLESSTAYGRKIAQGVSQYVREHEHWVLDIEDRGLFSLPAPLIRGWTGDGIISRTSDGMIRTALNQCKCPIVELLSINEELPIEVLPDDRKTMELCIEHFQERGITSIGFYAFGYNWWIERRHNLFLEIADKSKLDAHCLVDTQSSKAEVQPEWSDQYERMLKQWIKKLPPQTGIVTAYDPQAIRVLNICNKLGIHVPEQIAVLGIDNDEHLCNMTTPTLSSLDRNAECVGYKAAELLDRKMNRKKLPRRPIVVPPKGVVVRRSTEVMALDDPDISEALRYIADYATQGIGLSEVAEHVGLSRSTLCRRFQCLLKRSPKDEIM